MKNKYQELTIDYLSFKNKLDQLRINQLANNVRK